MDRTDPVWRTRDGREIPLSQIPDEHLLNIQRYHAERNRYERWRPEWSVLIPLEVVRRNLVEEVKPMRADT